MSRRRIALAAAALAVLSLVTACTEGEGAAPEPLEDVTATGAPVADPSDAQVQDPPGATELPPEEPTE